MEYWREKLYRSALFHSGRKWMKWGVRNGPPYPLDEQKRKQLQKQAESSNIVEEAIRSGKVKKEINPDKQLKHTLHGHLDGRSYINGDVEYAQKLVDRLSGTGRAVCSEDGRWLNKEAVTETHVIGMHVDRTGISEPTNAAMIAYSKTGTHIYPRRKDYDES